jgi:hypothetical protein
VSTKAPRLGHRLDITAETVIAARRSVVARFAVDPDHADRWHGNVRHVRWTPPLTVGSQIAIDAYLAGRCMSYVHEVVYWQPAEMFVLRSVNGPYRIVTAYTWEDVDGGTRMTVHKTGTAAPLLGRPAALLLHQANLRNLRRLKTHVETLTRAYRKVVTAYCSALAIRDLPEDVVAELGRALDELLEQLGGAP